MEGRNRRLHEQVEELENEHTRAKRATRRRLNDNSFVRLEQPAALQMDASKGPDRRTGRLGPVTLVAWAWRRRLHIAVVLIVFAATLILGPWRLGAWPLTARSATPVTTADMPAQSPVPVPLSNQSLKSTTMPALAPAPTPASLSMQAPPAPMPNSIPKTTPTSLSAKALALRRCLGGVVTVEKGGRFGNCFMEWATAWAIARKYNLTLATPTNLYIALHQAFSDLPTGPTVASLLRDCPVGQGLSEDDAFLNAVKTRNVSKLVADFASAVANATAAAPAPGPLAFSKYVVLPAFIAERREELRAQVRWRTDLREGAQATLRQVAAEVAQRFSAAAHEVVFVGVHARRTDYPAWMKKRMHVQVEADADYYARALLHVARTLEEEAEVETGRAAGPLAAVVASDDMPWVRHTLLPALDNMGRTSTLRMVSFAAGGGTEGSALQDLALLSACNHTVMAYGTYGSTAALLSGGHVVAFDLNPTYPTSHFAALLPGWITMR